MVNYETGRNPAPILGRVCKASARAATDGQISRIHSQTGSSRPFEPLGAGSQAFWEEVCKHALGRVCKLTMDPRYSSIRLFRKAASELLCKHALALECFVSLFHIGQNVSKCLKFIGPKA